MLIIGLTGGIGSGKTTVSNLFSDLGTHIIDTDVIAHELLNNSELVKNEIIDIFSKNVLNTHGFIDRNKLASIVFNDGDKKKCLEKILHPKIRAEVDKKIQSYQLKQLQPQYLIVVIPLLLETGFIDYLDRVLVVIASEEIRSKRVQQRDNRKIEDIQLIIKSQVSDKKRIDNTDDIIENNNDINELRLQVQRLHDKYTSLLEVD
jgi:dephospho-CoA kinase